MSPDLSRPYQELEHSRTKLIKKVIEASTMGYLIWDFSSFDNDIFGQMAVARKSGLTFVSTHIQDEGIEFGIFVGKGAENTVEIDSFRGFEAHRLREFLCKLAWLDDKYKERQLDKIRHQASQELLNLETFNQKKDALTQALELLAA